MPSVIRVKDVKKDFYVGLKVSKVEALKGVSFEVPQGSVTCFLGPNGSGKSTFIKIATGLVKPTSGQIYFFDHFKYSQIRSRIGFVPEKPMFPGFLTPIEVLNFVGSVSKNFHFENIESVLESVDLLYAKDRPCGGFSKGMNQRLALAQALLSEPDLLILDEPFNGLDPESRSNSVEILKTYIRNGKSIFLTSHLLEDVQKVCNHLVVIKEGELLYEGSLRSLFKTSTFSVEYRSCESYNRNIQKERSPIDMSKGSPQEEDLKLLSKKVSEKDLSSFLQSLLQEGQKIWTVKPDNQELTQIYKTLLEGENVSSNP